MLSVDMRDVYMIRESDLMDLKPCEHNTDAENYLNRIANMNDAKQNPLVFVRKTNFMYSLLP